MAAPAAAPWLLRQPYAHRGLWGRFLGPPENSLAAFEAARRARIGVEIDVRLSADGRAMVFHDASLDRMTGEAGPLAARDAATLQRIALAGSREGIPTLEAVLDAIGRDTPALVELKTPPGAEGPLERAVVRAIAGRSAPIAAMSFNPDSLSALRDAGARGALGLLFDGWRVLAGRARLGAGGARPDFFASGLDALRTHAAPAAHRNGAPLLAWTVRTSGQLDYARRYADQVIFEHIAPALAAGRRPI